MNHNSAVENRDNSRSGVTLPNASVGGSRKNRPKVLVLVCALAVVIAILGYQNLVTIPALKKPQVLTVAPPMLRAARTARETRGQSQKAAPASVTITVQENDPVRVAFDIPPGEYGSYYVEILSDSGAKKFSAFVSAQDAKDTVQILFPVGTLGTGRYNVLIQGIRAAGENSRVEVAKYSFEVRFQK